jgi:CheY-like chemotaxis protein
MRRILFPCDAWSDAVMGAEANQAKIKRAEIKRAKINRAKINRAKINRAKINRAQPIRVLLVEDEFLISEMVAEDLSERGFAVRAVSNASEALSHLASAPVDILFTDIKLPGGMDGITLARRARDMKPDLPVVYASGHVSMLDLEARVPGSIFIAKPYVPSLVGRILVSVMKGGAGRAGSPATSAQPARERMTA